MDSQEDALKAGRTPGDATWGHDPRPGTLTTPAGDTRTIDGVPGDYRHYYAAVRAAILGTGPNPVPASQALAVMLLIEAGLESSRRRCEVSVPDLSAAPATATA
jgi:predicted dehydrogenase